MFIIYILYHYNTHNYNTIHIGTYNVHIDVKVLEKDIMQNETIFTYKITYL